MFWEYYFNKITTINLTENLWNPSSKFTAVLKSSKVKVPKINTSSSRFYIFTIEREIFIKS